MSEGPRPQPQWFKIAKRALGASIVIGLAGLLAYGRYHVPMPVLLVGTFAHMTLLGAPAFMLLEWIGYAKGYVRGTDLTLYSLLFVVLYCGGMLWPTID